METATPLLESEHDGLTRTIAELLEIDLKAVQRILELLDARDSATAPDWRYLAAYCAADEPPLATSEIRKIIQTKAMLDDAARYCEKLIEAFKVAEDAATTGAATLGEGAWNDSDRAVEQTLRLDLLAERRADLAKARNRRDVEDVMAELSARYEAQRRRRGIAEGIGKLADLLFAGRGGDLDHESEYTLAERLAPEAVVELDGPDAVIEEAIELATLEVSAWPGLRAQLRAELALAGVVVVRPSQSRPDIIVPANLASLRVTVQELSPRQVRELYEESRELELSLRVELDETRALAILSEFDAEAGSRKRHDFANKIKVRALREHLLPPLGRELRDRLIARAHRHEIELVGQAYLHRLDSLPIEEHEILAIDPGYTSGCRLATVRRDGSLIDHGAYELIGAGVDPEAARRTIENLLDETRARVIGLAVAEGHQELATRIREVIGVPPAEGDDDWDVDQDDDLVEVFLVDGLALDAAAGAPPLKECYPDADLKLRRAIATGRRLLDPFAAWSEIDPRAIAAAYEFTGLDPSALARNLDEVLRNVVAMHGLDVNHAPEPLLSRLPGIDRQVAAALVKARREGAFHSRAEIAAAGLMDASTWDQLAGYLLVRTEESDPVDGTTVHPRDAELARKIIDDLPMALPRLRARTRVGEGPRLDIAAIAKAADASRARVEDVLAKLIGHENRFDRDRDPAEELAGVADEVFDELIPGMEVRGVVGDMVSYGAFVDIGSPQPALIHISELAERFVPDPQLIVRNGDEVVARVLSIEDDGRRVALSLRRDSRGPLKSNDSPPGAPTATKGYTTRSASSGRSAPAAAPAVRSSRSAERYPRVGDIVEGVLQRVVEYGAFVELGLSRAGLLHRTQIGLAQGEEPRDLMGSGERILARVIESDAATQRIGLSLVDVPENAHPNFVPDNPPESWKRTLRALADAGQSGPSHSAAGGRGSGGSDRNRAPAGPRSRPVNNRVAVIKPVDFPDDDCDEPDGFEDTEEGMVVHGIVTKTTSYGIFVDLEIDVPALIHISEIADEYVREPGSLVRPGDRLRAHVLRVDRDNRCLALTLRRPDAGMLAD